MREIERILAVPVADYSALGRRTIREWTHRLAYDRSAVSILEPQAGFLEAVADASAARPGPSGAPGALGLIECGGGKTLGLQFALLQAQELGADRPMLMTKARLFRELKRERERWCDVFRLPRMPQLDDLGEGGPCAIMSYGKLSHQSGEDELLRVAPDVLFLDEAHILGRGARRMRMWRYIKKFRGVRVHAVTGSLTNASLYDFVHLMALVCRDWCPLPIRTDMLDQWASVVDLKGEADDEARRSILPLLQRVGLDYGLSAGPRVYDPIRFRRAAREAVMRRITETRGVYQFSQGLADCSLSITVEAPRASIEAARALARLQSDWVMPDGRELVDHLEAWQARKELALGYFRRWDPNTADEDWFEARRAWFSYARAMVEHRGFDTLGEVSKAAEDGRLDTRGRVLWGDWQTVNEDPGSRPVREVIWLDKGRTVADTVHQWLNNRPDPGRCAVWFQSRVVGDKLAKMMPVHYSGLTPPNSGPAAIGIGHATGWNGQYGFNDALVLEPPTTGLLMEQLLSRHHRQGQTHDVEVTLIGGVETRTQVIKAAEYAAETTRATQRALIADWL